MSMSSQGRPKPGLAAPRMSDVAALAGVSHQTVSRVLNDHPAVRDETRERVQAAIISLGYRRNSAARALVTRRSATIGVISFDTTLFGPASTLYGIEQAAHLAGYYVSVASNKTISRATVLDGLQRLAAQSVEGFIVIAPQREAFAAVAELPRDVPVVVVEGRTASWAPVVSVDQVQGGRIATEHLLAQGAETVWHIGGPPDWLEAEGREVGWRAVLTEAGIEPPRVLRGDWTAGSGYAAGQALARQHLDSQGAIGAVFVGNDQMALGTLRAFHEAGVRVPNDVLVAGFDDVPEAAYFTPPLTTVRQDFAAVGRLSIELLLRRIAGDTAPDLRSVVEPELIIRQSSARGGVSGQR
jgi:DNA-binding LacI/PurR family transcriptional regulator